MVELEVVSGCTCVSPFSLCGHQAGGCHWSLEPKKMRPTTSFRNTLRGLELPWWSTEQGAVSQGDKHRLTCARQGTLLVNSCCACAPPVVSRWAVSSFKPQWGLKVSFILALVILVCRRTA